MAMATPSRLLLVPLAAVALVAAACGDDDDANAAGTTDAPPAGTQDAGAAGDIVVFAATSLTESFTAIGEAFTAAHPDATATFSFDGSSALVQQIIQGAPADVFASADTVSMDKLVAADLDGSDPEIFATNRLTIIVAPDNPLGITGVADLADPDIKTVVCASEVPCGNYAGQVFARAGVAVTPVSLEQNVRGVTTKVTAGEADAGIVYVTDVLAAGDDAAMVEIPADINVVAQYPVATVATSEHQDVDRAFIDFLTGPEAQGILADHGFDGP
jgi:molybdate transport system substrate-binding protein